MFITNFYKEFERVNSISSTVHVSNTQEGQERNRKKIISQFTDTTHSRQF